MSQLKLLLDGLEGPEGPRWHEGQLWFSDMRAHRVMKVDLAGHAETVVEVPGQPSGLGWLPDGRLLVVSMTDRRLLRLDPGGLTEVADLLALASFHCNDMVVDQQGRAYIGNFGWDYRAGPPIKLAEIIMVMPDGGARIVARLTAFAIESDGSLTRRRTWAQFDELGPGFGEGRVIPDGISLDAEGAVWVASPATAEVLHVREGGQITHRLRPSAGPLACMLGGPRRQTLFVLVPRREEVSGRIELFEADIPGAGYP
jgi:sugar lactone lactonase YvrE